MDSATKRHLHAHTKSQRAKKKLLKDQTIGDLGVACDWFEDRGETHHLTSPFHSSYLKYASPVQVEVLAKRLPSRWALVSVPYSAHVTPKPNEVQFGLLRYRKVIAFPTSVLRLVLEFLVDDAHKYMGSKWPCTWLWLNVKTGRVEEKK